MSIETIANRLVELCRTGQYGQAHDELYHNDCISIEPEGAPVVETKGLEGIRAKGQQFASMVEEYHKNEVSDPVIADRFFSVGMKMDVTFKGMGRQIMEEVALYEVKDGKIVKEQFFFTPMAPQG